jgi:divalent metal cation (Fe/Co/Zn/Cd) transporter
MTTSRASLISAALGLSYFTIGWNGAVGGIALAVAFLASSVALAALALSALLDTLASLVLVWRFRKEQRHAAAADQVERRAQALIVVAMLIVAGYIGFQAVKALALETHAEEAEVGIVLAALSAAVLPFLARRKFRVAAELGSAALRGDGVLTLAAAALACLTLVALAVARDFDLWWADPVAALIIAAALVGEATRIGVRHAFG